MASTYHYPSPPANGNGYLSFNSSLIRSILYCYNLFTKTVKQNGLNKRLDTQKRKRKNGWHGSLMLTKSCQKCMHGFLETKKKKQFEHFYVLLKLLSLVEQNERTCPEPFTINYLQFTYYLSSSIKKVE